MNITAGAMHFKDLNGLVRESEEKNITIDNCMGQRYIGAASSGKKITINGTPGNALGCYLNGSDIIVNGNAQDATGDTMNTGRIIVKGNCGDTTGYGMRGGKIFAHGDSGYRTGIHMKSYIGNPPVVIIGGAAGTFLGEYQAGGYIIVLGMNTQKKRIVGNFCGTGMHGGKMYLRCSLDEIPDSMPAQVKAELATPEDMAEIDEYLDEYCKLLKEDKKEILDHQFVVITPNSANPYHNLYVNI
ncbi:MAG: glutamate synthase [Oscillospiraceae bacterium]|nr:glutamate synthase [Oscillospiraceae bacterium]